MRSKLVHEFFFPESNVTWEDVKELLGKAALTFFVLFFGAILFIAMWFEMVFRIPWMIRCEFRGWHDWGAPQTDSFNFTVWKTCKTCGTIDR